MHAPVHTVQVLGTHILARVGGHGSADAFQGHAEELGRLAAGGLCGHDVAAQTVHGTLQHHAANGRDAALQAHGDAHAAQLCTVGQAERAFVLAPAQLMVVAQDVQQTADASHRLAEHRGKGCTKGPHAEHDDAHQVQPDVQRTGHQQKIQGPLAVAQSTHQGTGHIIKEGEGDAPEDGADVNICNVDDVGRGVGPHQHGAGERHGDHRQHHCKGYRQPHGVGRVAAHLFIVLGTEGPGDGDGKAAGNAVDKAQHQIVQAAHAAHGRQRFHAHKAAHDDGIGQVVELLEQAAQHQRHCKGKDQLQRAALRHILGHSFPPIHAKKSRCSAFLP